MQQIRRLFENIMSKSWTCALLFITSQSFAAPMNDCEMIDLDPRTFQINHHGQIITIIGWNHPGEYIRGLVESGLKATSALAEQKKCSEAHTFLNQNKIVFQDTYLEAKRVSNLLMSQKNHIKQIGVERAFEQTQDVLKYRKNIKDSIQYSVSLCPELKNILTDYFKVNPGPEFLFAEITAHPIIGVEDLQTLLDSERMIPKEMQEIDVSNLPLDPSVKKMFKKMSDFYFQNISEEQFLDLLRKEPNPEYRRLLTMYRDTTLALLKRVPARNAKMISRIISEGKNHALVVGFKHVDDFKKQLSISCASTIKDKRREYTPTEK
ncbi:MAG: hypothetical protein H6623_00125 [Bdellovibrionaceae bacterium]|nr:hypothetical protein [Pseudobdellovibrionaceae bacterium]